VRLLSATDVIITSGLIANVTGDIVLAYSGGYWSSEGNGTVIANVSYGIIFSTFDAISQYSQTADNITIIWDRIKVLTTQAIPDTQDATKPVTFHVTLELEYDNSAVESGTITFDGKLMSWDAINSRWQIVFTEQSAGRRLYFFNNTSNDGMYGITIANLNGKSATVEWGPAPESGSGHDYDRPLFPTIVTQSTLVVILAGGILIGYVYLYGIPFVNITELNGLTDQERRTLYRSILDQFRRTLKRMRNIRKEITKRLGRR